MRRPARRYPKPLTLQAPAGQWAGMVDARETVASTASHVALAENVYRRFAVEGTSYIGRPGFALMGAQMGSVGNRAANWCGQFTKYDGTEYTVAVIQGEIHTYNWGSPAWTKVVTAANFATASITRSATSRWYAVPYGDTLCFSDGINIPFTWSGASGAGGLVSVSNCPVLFGQPVVRASKLVGVKAAERDTIVWSEEADINTGYEAGGYVNAWSLGGAYSHRLFALGATNEIIAVIRERSATAIRGAISTDFTTSSTTPDVSATLGTNTPFTAVLNEGVLFVDQDGRPHLIVPGAQDPVPLWGAFEQYLRGVNRTQLDKAQIVEDLGCDVVLVGVPTSDDTWPATWLAYQRDRGGLVPVAVWSGFTAQASGLVKDGDKLWKWMHIGEDDGYAYVHDIPTGVTWNDANGTSTVPIEHAVLPRPLATDSEDECVFTDMVLHSTAPTECDLTVSYVTSRARGSTQTLSLGLTGAAWDAFNWDEANWSDDTPDQRGAVGLLGRGRYIQPEVRHSVLGQQFGLASVRVHAMVEGADPLIP